jgi:hypothetical protein
VYITLHGRYIASGCTHVKSMRQLVLLRSHVCPYDAHAQLMLTAYTVPACIVYVLITLHNRVQFPPAMAKVAESTNVVNLSFLGAVSMVSMINYTQCFLSTCTLSLCFYTLPGCYITCTATVTTSATSSCSRCASSSVHPFAYMHYRV